MRSSRSVKKLRLPVIKIPGVVQKRKSVDQRKSELLLACFAALRSLTAGFFLAASTTGADCSTFATFTSQLSGIHKLLVSSANHIARHFQRVGKFAFTREQGSRSQLSCFDQIIELFTNLTCHRLRAFSIDTNIESASHR